MELFFAESDFLTDFTDGLGSDIEERGNVLQVEMLHNAGAALHQQFIAFAGRGAVEVDIARTELKEDVLGNDGTQLHRLLALVEVLLQLLTRNPEHTTGHHRLDGGLRRIAVKECRIIDHVFTFKRKPSDMRPFVADAIVHILEASALHVCQPPRRVTLALQLVALAVNDRLALPLAELPQRLYIYAIIAKLLFHYLCLASERMSG